MNLIEEEKLYSLIQKKPSGNDKQERATVEQVLDPKTMLILFKLINNDYIHEVHGCISTGKEANVYHATTSDEKNRAIKIYKTSILVFKDRDRYVSGEYRFRNGYCKSNPRKMVKVWAEKEMRNLKRLELAGIPCPQAIVLKKHVLLMGFIGDSKGWAAPRLKDALIEEQATYQNVFEQLLKQMWKMYHLCRLVHADLSEYNLLYYKTTLYMIDVSQSVEHDHPHALEFLRKDCKNVLDYFKKTLEKLPSIRKLFEFIVTDLETISSILKLKNLEKVCYEKVQQHQSCEELDKVLDAYIKHFIDKLLRNVDDEEDDAVFGLTYIPRTLDEVKDVEKEIFRSELSNQDQIYKSVMGISVEKHLDQDLNALNLESENSSSDDDEEEEGEEGEEGESEDDEEGEDAALTEENYRKSRGKILKKDEDKEEKKERKKLVKNERKLKREVKMKKNVKKRKEKETSGKKKK
ncbi:protein kinase rio1 [Clydaea vesicula]|uniref:Serine/threonine-protein kinase RIO1 n=1 Tax=Clydaea vesicula TaxID=447962 RepID=A0AAD5U5G3_9FUNG|nr:protein kinase rio1 [Clydaea vesicula]